MVHLKQNERVYNLMVLTVTLFILNSSFLHSQSEQRRGRDRGEEVIKIIDRAINERNVKTLYELAEYSSKELSVVAKEKVVNIYKKLRQDLFYDKITEQKNNYVNYRSSPIVDYIRLVEATGTNQVYDLILKDIHEINLLNPNLFDKWQRQVYYGNCTAAKTFSKLIEKLSASKLPIIQQRLMHHGRSQLLKIYLHKLGGKRFNKNKLSYVKAFAKMYSDIDKKYSSDKGDVSGKHKKTLARNIFDIFTSMESEGQTKIRKILGNRSIIDEFEQIHDQ